MEPHNKEGVRGLWAAVLIQAFKDLRMMSTDLEGRSPASVRALAWEWIHSPVTYGRDPDTDKSTKKQKVTAYRSQDVGGFLWCCDVLDLDPEYYRQLSTTREGINSLLGKHGNNQYVNKTK